MPDEAGVVLASIARSKTGRSVVIDHGGRRRDIYSVAQLLDLILSLADRLTAVEGAQSAARGKPGA